MQNSVEQFTGVPEGALGGPDALDALSSVEFTPRELLGLIGGFDVEQFVAPASAYKPKDYAKFSEWRAAALAKLAPLGLADENGTLAAELQAVLAPLTQAETTVADAVAPNRAGDEEYRNVVLYILGDCATAVVRQPKLRTAFSLVSLGAPATWEETFRELFGLEGRFAPSRFEGVIVNDSDKDQRLYKALRKGRVKLAAEYARTYGLPVNGLREVAEGKKLRFAPRNAVLLVSRDWTSIEASPQEQDSVVLPPALKEAFPTTKVTELYPELGFEYTFECAPLEGLPAYYFTEPVLMGATTFVRIGFINHEQVLGLMTSFDTHPHVNDAYYVPELLKRSGKYVAAIRKPAEGVPATTANASLDALLANGSTASRLGLLFVTGAGVAGLAWPLLANALSGFGLWGIARMLAFSALSAVGFAAYMALWVVCVRRIRSLCRRFPHSWIAVLAAAVLICALAIALKLDVGAAVVVAATPIIVLLLVWAVAAIYAAAQGTPPPAEPEPEPAN